MAADIHIEICQLFSPLELSCLWFQLRKRLRVSLVIGSGIARKKIYQGKFSGAGLEIMKGVD